MAVGMAPARRSGCNVPTSNGLKTDPARIRRNIPCSLRLLGRLLLSFVHTGMSQAQDGRATVRLDGRVLFQAGQGSAASSEERARAIERRLATLLRRFVEDQTTESRLVTGRQPIS